MKRVSRDVEENHMREICAERVWELAMIADLSPSETRKLARVIAVKLSKGSEERK